MNTATVSERLSKFGGTQYYVKNINVTLDDGLIMPASKINEMRRTAIQKLMAGKNKASDTKLMMWRIQNLKKMMCHMPQLHLQMQAKYLIIILLKECLSL